MLSLFRSKTTQFILKLLFTILIISIILQKIDFHSLKKIFQENINITFVIGANIMLLSTLLFQAWRWKIMAQNSKLNVFKFLYFIFLGMFLNNILPGTFGGDIAKTVLFGKKIW